MTAVLSDVDSTAIEARIRAFEARTGIEVVTAVVPRSDRYHGLRWRAFALGVALAALAVVVTDLWRPDWIHAYAVLFAVVSILGAGLACALLANAWPAFERRFLQRERAEAEVRNHAKALFLSRELFATPERTAVLLLASQFERVAVVFGDRGYRGRVTPDEWRSVVDAMTPPFERGDVRHALLAGLDALETLLGSKGFVRRGPTRDLLPDKPLTPTADDE